MPETKRTDERVEQQVIPGKNSNISISKPSHIRENLLLTFIHVAFGHPLGGNLEQSWRPNEIELETEGLSWIVDL